MQPFGNIKQLVPVGADAIMLYFQAQALSKQMLPVNNGCVSLIMLPITPKKLGLLSVCHPMTAF